MLAQIAISFALLVVLMARGKDIGMAEKSAKAAAVEIEISELPKRLEDAERVSNYQSIDPHS